MAIYKNQSLLTLRLNAGIDVSGASEAKILYRKPTGVTGEWTATVSTTYVVYDVQTADLDVAGKWSIQSKVTISGEVGYSDIVELQISERIV